MHRTYRLHAGPALLYSATTSAALSAVDGDAESLLVKINSRSTKIIEGAKPLECCGLPFVFLAHSMVGD